MKHLPQRPHAHSSRVLVTVLLGIMAIAGAAAALDPSEEGPTEPSLRVRIDRVCFQVEEGPNGTLYRWFAEGQMDERVSFGAFTLVFEHLNGSKSAYPWWYSAERSGLVGAGHPRFRGAAPYDWSRWSLLMLLEQSLTESVRSITLWVRGFRGVDTWYWDQDSRVVYTDDGGFVCEGTDLAPAVSVLGVLGCTAAVCGSVGVRRGRRARRPGTKDEHGEKRNHGNTRP